MNNLQVSEDGLTISRCNIPNIFDLPNDLFNNILSRLPVKSIAKLCCISKLWSSIFCRPHISELLSIKSSGSPRIYRSIVILLITSTSRSY
ncbi:unnamed protein product [Arabidopsis halleri]